MSTYSVSNLSSSTSKQDQDKLINAVNNVQGVKSTKLFADRKELSFEFSGVAPTYEAIKQAGKGAGFEIEQSKPADEASGPQAHEQKSADHKSK